MKVTIQFVGKTNERYLEEGITNYFKRLKHYLPVELSVLPDLKKAGKRSADQLKEQEGERILASLHPADRLILLDEKGKSFSSVDFAAWLDKQLQGSHRRLVFQVGGAYGFSPAVYERADQLLTLSAMTFSHQMVRLFLLEQLYRAQTILRNEPYHNP